MIKLNVLEHKEINNIFEDLQNNEKGIDYEKTECPIIKGRIGTCDTNILIDSGSEITAMEEQFFWKNHEKFNKVEILPTTKTSIITATGKRSPVSNKQIFLTVHINNQPVEMVMLLVKSLAYQIIVGVDTLSKVNMIIDFQSKTLTYTNSNSIRQSISFNRTSKGESVKTKKIFNDKVQISSVKEYDRTKLNLEVIEATVDLTIQEKSEVSKLLEEHEDVFSSEPGLGLVEPYQIRVTDESPYKLKHYPIKPTILPAVQKEIQRMLELGIIEPASSCFVNPMVVVPKKNGSVRVCLDARRINARTIPEYDAPPRVEDILYDSVGTKCISTLDLTSSFWQIPLHKNSRQYTAFVFENIVYQYRVVPFGLKNSLAALVQLLHQILPQRHNERIRLYVDDILVRSGSFHEHIKHLRFVFKKLREYGLTLNLEKSKLFRNQVPFLGYILTTSGIMKDPTKIEAIEKFPTPKNVKHVRAFLGLTNYYGRFSKDYSEECIPLINLTKKDSKWVWGTPEEAAFKHIKELFLNDIKLWHPDYNKIFYLQTDSSDHATGAHLYQKGDKNEIHTIAFTSKSMKPSELNYTTTEKELLAVIQAIRKFYSMIAGYKIIVLTDHKAITFLHTCKNPTQRISRWLLYLQPLDIEVQYIPGPENIIPDALSRNPADREEVETFEKAFKISIIKISEEASGILKQLHNHQIENNKLKNIIENEDQYINFKMVNKVLYKKVGQRWLAVLPDQNVDNLIEEIHKAYGHIGSNKCFKLIHESFTADKLKKRIKKITKKCEVCQKNKCSPMIKAPTQFIDVEKKLQMVSIDFIGPFPTGIRGMKYILVCIDNFSKYVKLYPTQSPSTRQAVRALERYYCDVGQPEAVLTDNGTAFTAAQWKTFLNSKGSRHILTAIRHPQGNLSERTNRDVTTYLRILVGDKQSGWVKHVPDIEKTLNETYHSAIEMTPYEAQFNSVPERIWNQFIDQNVNKGKGMSEEQLRILINERLKEKGRKRVDIANKDCKKFYEFKPGDLVLIKSLNLSDKSQGKAAKLMPVYEGPYPIVKKIHKTTYIVGRKNINKIRGMFHASCLKPYFSE